MSINWSSYVLADTTFVRAIGRQTLGNYGLRLVVQFTTNQWKQPDIPTVTLAPSAATLVKPINIFAGLAAPECSSPFQISQYTHRSEVAFDIIFNQSAMNSIESARNGDGVDMTLRLNGSISCGSDIARVDDSIHISINQTDWLRVLGECGHGKSLLFEVPLDVNAGSETEPIASELEAARRHLMLSHYQEVVAICRRVIERLNQCLGHDSALATARSVKGEGKKSLSIFDRELLIRGTAMDFASLAHHADQVQSRPFDRLDASMMLGITATLVNTALTRAATTEG